MSSTNDTLAKKTQGAVNESGQESADQEVRSTDLPAATLFKSSDASVPLKSTDNQVQGSPITLGPILSLHVLLLYQNSFAYFLSFIGVLNFFAMTF